MNQLRNVLESLDADDGGRVLRMIAQAVTGARLREACWEEDLYDTLAKNELCYQVSDILTKPQPLDYVVRELSARLGRQVPEEEVLLWLALAVASSRTVGHFAARSACLRAWSWWCRGCLSGRQGRTSALAFCRR